MIEPTDEMVQAYVSAWRDRLFKEPQDQDRPAVRAGLAAVLAIVERDHCLKPQGHVYHPLAMVRAITDPCLCGADLGPPWSHTPHQKGTRGCRAGKS